MAGIEDNLLIQVSLRVPDLLFFGLFLGLICDSGVICIDKNFQFKKNNLNISSYSMTYCRD